MGGTSAGCWRVGITLALLAAVWWPARPGGRDGFPLSTYPMFGYARASTSKIDTVVGIDPDGQRRPLSPALVGGVVHPKLALRRVIEAVAEQRTDALCSDVARRVAAHPPVPRPLELEVVTETWDTLHALDPDAEPLTRVVHARCEVPR